MRKYSIKNLGNNTVFEDVWRDPHSSVPILFKGNLLADPYYEGDALLRTEYPYPLEEDSHKKNIFKYSWLPVHTEFDCQSNPVTCKSAHFAQHLGLHNLYYTYSGYAPSIGATNITGSFKEFEAVGVLGRLGSRRDYTLVLASAGNSGRAFAELGSALDINIIIVVPEHSVKEIRTTTTPSPNIKVYYVEDGDYTDAIQAANTIAQFDGCIAEGGVRNIGRRDGMGIAFLSAVQYMQRIPDHYFQAVGSASGAISTWEASIRFNTLMDTPGPAVPKLHLSQNYPFTPIVDSWEQHSPTLLAIDSEKASEDIAQISAKVLSNRTPPYSTVGGIYEAMCASQGRGYRVSNEEIQRACALFLEKEHIDLDPAAGVACASLMQAVQSRQISPEDHIMLNLTGGGYSSIEKDFQPQTVVPSGSIPKQASIEVIKNIILN